MREATTCGDLSRLNQLIDSIDDDDVAALFRYYANEFRYDEVLVLLESGRPHAPG